MPGKVKRHPDGLVALRESAVPGCCIVCFRSLPKTGPRRRWVICRRKSCRRVYQRLYRRDWDLTHPGYNQEYNRI